MEYSLIVDSCVWVALFHKDDSCHPKALEIQETLRSVKIIPDFILQETATVLKNKKDLKSAVFFLELFSENQNVEIASFLVDYQKIFSEEFCKKENKKLSYIDSSLLALHKTKKFKVLTFDTILKKLMK